MICLERVQHSHLPGCRHTICKSCLIQWSDFNLIKQEQKLDVYQLDQAQSNHDI
jgi:hypothetical protein